MPIFQNRVHDTEAEAKAYPKGDVLLVEDQQTGLEYHAVLSLDLVTYDDHYQNEQVGSRLFRRNLHVGACAASVHR